MVFCREPRTDALPCLFREGNMCFHRICIGSVSIGWNSSRALAWLMLVFNNFAHELELSAPLEMEFYKLSTDGASV